MPAAAMRTRTPSPLGSGTWVRQALWFLQRTAFIAQLLRRVAPIMAHGALNVTGKVRSIRAGRIAAPRARPGATSATTEPGWVS